MEVPKAILSEQAVLGAILLDSNNISQALEIIGAEKFYNSRHSVIFACMKKLFDDGLTIDIATLSQALNASGELRKVGGASYLVELLEGATVYENVVHHSNVINDMYIKRETIIILRQTLEETYKNAKESKDIILETTEKLYKLSGDTNKMHKLSDAVFSSLNDLEDRFNKKGDIIGNSTGVDKLDMAIGGLKKGELVIIAGRPSMGKTAFALNIASNIAKSKNVAIFSFEMTKEELADRLLSDEGSINLGKIKTGKLADEEFERVAQASCSLCKRFASVYDGGALTVSEIKAKAMQIKANEGLDLIVIDYLQLISGEDKFGGNRVYEISKISRDLKSLAKELQVSVVALSQLSRGTEARVDKRPMLSDLRDSGSIEQDADIIIMLYRDEYYNIETTNKGICEVLVGKNRNGKTGMIKLNWLPQFQRFCEVKK